MDRLEAGKLLKKPCGNDVGIDVGNIDVETRRLEGLDSQSSPG